MGTFGLFGHDLTLVILLSIAGPKTMWTSVGIRAIKVRGEMREATPSFTPLKVVAVGILPVPHRRGEEAAKW